MTILTQSEQRVQEELANLQDKHRDALKASQDMKSYLSEARQRLDQLAVVAGIEKEIATTHSERNACDHVQRMLRQQIDDLLHKALLADEPNPFF